MIVTEHPDFDPPQLRIAFEEHFPMWIRIDMMPGSETFVLAGVVRTFGFPGARSDYHDLISLIWAAFLRSHNIASVSLLDIPHPVIPGELYGRYVLFDKQPSTSFISLANPDYESIEKILFASSIAGAVFSTLYRESGGNPDEEDCQGSEGEEWRQTIVRHLRIKTARDRYTLTNHRRLPTWVYCRLNMRGVTAFKLNGNLMPDLLGSKDSCCIVEGITGYLIKTGSIENFISRAAYTRLVRLLQAYGERITGRPEQLLHSSYLILPIESHVICVTPVGIAALQVDCSLKRFVSERALLLKRNQSETAMLHSTVNFVWSEKLDHGRFEEMVLQLVNREPGVNWARQVGVVNASDGGRDIIADWWLGPTRWQKASEKAAMERQQVVIQCKAFTKSVNLSNLPDVAQVLDLHDASGYLVVAYPQVTPQVVDYLTRVPKKRGFWADWWTKAELEEKLRANVDIARRFPDLLTVVTCGGND